MDLRIRQLMVSSACVTFGEFPVEPFYHACMTRKEWKKLTEAKNPGKGLLARAAVMGKSLLSVCPG